MTTVIGVTSKIVNLYRPPYSTSNPRTLRQFLKEFDEFLSLLLEHKGVLMILGDFNINFLNKDDNYTKEFIHLITHYNLKQLITKYTHIKGGLIDLILIETSNSTVQEDQLQYINTI